MAKNSKILAAVVSAWAKPLIDSVLLKGIGSMQPFAAASEWVKKYFPVPADYSIVNDLAFLAVPATEMIVGPMVEKAVSRIGLSDEQIPAYAAKIADAMLAEAKGKGQVTLFDTIELEESDFKRLKKLLDKNLPAGKTDDYKVIE